MNNRKKLFLCCLICFGPLFSWAQEYGIFGRIVDVNKDPISFANVVLQRQSDSSFVAGTSTDENGSFALIPLQKDDYLITISFIGFTDILKSFSLESDLELGELIMQESAEMLDEISIIGRKPKIIKKPDRLTFNIENTALTQGNTLQVLKSTPGIIVSEGSINIKSSPATVFINNKRVQLNSQELMQLLESAPANSIKSVEVITNPPASFDADSGSVINIVMSKNLIAGYRGSVGANYTQGVYPRYNAETSHFFKNEKIDFNVNYSYTNQKINKDNIDTVNYLNSNNEIEEIWSSNIDQSKRSESHNLNLNLDYTIDDNNTLSLTSTGLYTPYFKYDVNNNTLIEDQNEVFQSRFKANSIARDDKLNIGSDLNYTHIFDNESNLSVNLHYTYFDYERNQNALTDFFDQNNEFDFDSEFNTMANQETNILTSKVDYNTDIDETSSLALGGKFSKVKTDSDIIKTDLINGVPVVDLDNTDSFVYDEMVFAAYASYRKSWDNWDLSLGIRAEQTNIEGRSESLNTTNTQDYLEWFPTLSLSYQLSEDVSIYGNYKRSITRPNYTNLNPFTFFLNENTVVVGNPNLVPTFKDHYIIGTSFLDYFTVEAYYINYDGAINQLPRQNNETNIIAFTPVNIDKTVDFGFDFSADFYLTDRWSVFALTSFYNMSEETNFGDGFVQLDQWANISILSNNLYLLEDNSLTINFNMTYGSKNLQNLAILDARLISSLSVSKTIWNGKGVISLSAEDLFNEQDYFWTVDYLNQSNTSFTDSDNRFVKLGFRYNFGNTKLNTNEQGTEAEERDRLEGGDL